MKTEMGYSGATFKNVNQQLIEGCKAGDLKSQFQIYKLYYKSLYDTSLDLVNDTIKVEDILQESFLYVFEKINTYSGTVSFGAWLEKIVLTRSQDVLKKEVS